MVGIGRSAGRRLGRGADTKAWWAPGANSEARSQEAGLVGGWTPDCREPRPGSGRARERGDWRRQGGG